MGRKVNKAGRFARHGTDAGNGMGCNSPRVGHCDARMPRSVRYVRTRPVLLPSPGVYGRFMLSARLVAVRTFLSGASPPPEGAVRKAAQPMCFPGSLCRSPSALHCQTKIPFGVGNRRRGIFLPDPTAGGCGFPQDLLHLRPFFLHIRRKPQLCAAAVEILRWPVDLEIDIAVQIVL